MKYAGHDTLKTRRTLDVDGKSYTYYSLPAAAQAAGLGDIARLPFSMRVLLENLVRLENGRTVTGKALDTDTMAAAAYAYVNALNKLLVKREKQAPEALTVAR